MPAQHFDFVRARILGLGAVTVGSSRKLLFGYFDPEEFACDRNMPRPDAFIDRLRDHEFWCCNFYRNDAIKYSEAIEFYLHSHFHGVGVPRFEPYMTMWATSFYEARMDAGAASNLLILFLQQSLDVLEHLYILERPEHQDLRPSRSAIAECVDAARRADPIAHTEFSKWTLDDWLPFHLRYFQSRERFIEEF